MLLLSVSQELSAQLLLLFWLKNIRVGMS